MSDYSDQEEDSHDSYDRRRKKLENSLFAMKDMLEQLQGAREEVNDWSTSNDRKPQERRVNWNGSRSRGGVRGRGRGRARGRSRGRTSQRQPGGYNHENHGTRTQCDSQQFLRGDLEYQQNLQEQDFRRPFSPPHERGRGRYGQGFQREYRRQQHYREPEYRPPSRDSCASPVEKDEDYSRSPHHHDSFDEYSDHSRAPYQKHHTETVGIKPQFLVEILAKCPKFTSSLLQLLEQWNMKPPIVRNLALDYPHVFSLHGEMIVLEPNIRICQTHSSSEGCQTPNSCKALHICDEYVMNACYEKGCVLGHKWRTGHNDPVLCASFIEKLPFHTLRELVRTAEGPFRSSSTPLDICKDYNEDKGCKQRNCSSLHLCFSVVSELTNCKDSDCALNHNILSSSCSHLLNRHGIETNEAPRDVVMALLKKNPSLGNIKPSSNKVEISSSTKGNKKEGKKEDDAANLKSSDKKMKTKSKKASKAKEKSSGESSDSDSETSSDSDDSSGGENKKKQKNTGHRKRANKNKKDKATKESNSSHDSISPPTLAIQRTVWSHYLIGNVQIPEICYYSVEGNCKNESSVCPRLHATKDFHWQVSENGSRWLNLRRDYVTCLEYAYCDPAKSTAHLPRLDPSTLDHSVSGLFILLGRDLWEADFGSMVMTNSNKTKVLKIRRLCTEEIDGQIMKPSMNVWYFLDKNGSWVLYGDVDTAGASHLVSDVTSSEIERAYLRDSTSSLSFKNSKYMYVLDFKTMTQINCTTGVARKVIRKAYPHLQEKKKEEEKKKSLVGLPSSWKTMHPEERFCLVSLSPTSAEYKKIISLLNGRISASKVLKVQRIQNPFLWRAYENKVKEMMTVYKDAGKLDLRWLFHGTAPGIIDNICAENFDWRLHGSKSGQSFGRGSYFAVNADYSYKYAEPDDQNLRFMFVARVAVGTKVRGNSQMVRPPMNPNTSALFDASVDSVSNTTIVVKYDKQEYYPEYLLTLD